MDQQHILHDSNSSTPLQHQNTITTSSSHEGNNFNDAKTTNEITAAQSHEDDEPSMLDQCVAFTNNIQVDTDVFTAQDATLTCALDSTTDTFDNTCCTTDIDQQAITTQNQHAALASTHVRDVSNGSAVTANPNPHLDINLLEETCFTLVGLLPNLEDAAQAATCGSADDLDDWIIPREEPQQQQYTSTPASASSNNDTAGGKDSAATQETDRADGLVTSYPEGTGNGTDDSSAGADGSSCRIM